MSVSVSGCGEGDDSDGDVEWKKNDGKEKGRRVKGRKEV